MFVDSNDIRLPADREIIELIKSGDLSVINILHQNYSPTLLKYAKYKGLQEADAYDCISKTFVSLIEATHKLEASKGTIRSWMFRVIYNKIHDIYRTRSNKPSPELTIEIVCKKNADPSDTVANDEHHEMVLAAIREELPRDELSIFEAMYFGGLSHKELAISYNTTVPAIKYRLFRIRSKIRRILEAKRLIETAE